MPECESLCKIGVVLHSPTPPPSSVLRESSQQDLELDIPDAAHFVALFLGRAIVDEVLAPAFLTRVLQRMRDDSLGIQIVRSVGEPP